MFRARLLFIALVMALAVPVPTGADRAGEDSAATSALPAACTPDPDSDPDYSDTRWVWRLRAYRHLDCVNAVVERALSSASGDRVEISRADLERIRDEAWYARDAAARIGQ